MRTKPYFHEIILAQFISLRLKHFHPRAYTRRPQCCFNRPVVIGFEGHAVLLHSLENNHGKSKYVINSWSGQYEMNEDQLKKVLDSTFVSELVKK